jgi:hypothetical protein
MLREIAIGDNNVDVHIEKSDVLFMAYVVEKLVDEAQVILIGRKRLKRPPPGMAVVDKDYLLSVMDQIYQLVGRQFWNKTNPMTQFTGSFNPTHKDFLGSYVDGAEEEEEAGFEAKDEAEDEAKAYEKKLQRPELSPRRQRALNFLKGGPLLKDLADIVVKKYSLSELENSYSELMKIRKTLTYFCVKKGT